MYFLKEQCKKWLRPATEKSLKNIWLTMRRLEYQMQKKGAWVRYSVWQECNFLYFCRRVSPVRSAPAESPQGRKAARVGSCSDAIQIAYPLL